MSKKTFCLIWSLILSVLFCVPSFAASNVTVSAKSALLLECSSGSVLFEKNADERLPMASTTKIMTALVAIEKCPLDRIVTATSVSCGVEGSSIYMREGEKFTMEELLYALLLASANDAACLIAEEVAGDIPSFAEMMNSKAAELGLSDTHFSNPHGLDAEDHYTSAYDLARLASAALSSPVFRTIVSTYRKNIGSGENTRHLLNHNRLLKMYDDALGVKTGYTRSSGRCLVSAAERDGVMLVAVTLSDPDDWRDHTLLLDHGFDAVRTLLSPPKEAYRKISAVSAGIALSSGAQTATGLIRFSRPITVKLKRKYTCRISFGQVFPRESVSARLYSPVTARSSADCLCMLRAARNL